MANIRSYIDSINDAMRELNRIIHNTRSYEETLAYDDTGDQSPLTLHLLHNELRDADENVWSVVDFYREEVTYAPNS